MEFHYFIGCWFVKFDSYRPRLITAKILSRSKQKYKFLVSKCTEIMKARAGWKLKQEIPRRQISWQVREIKSGYIL